MDAKERQSLEKQLESHKENLQVLLEKRAQYVSPAQVPVQLEKDIRDQQREIEQIQELLTQMEEQAEALIHQPPYQWRESDVFIVHGHDEAAKESVARFIEKLGLRAIILHELPNAGRTIIEKFEDYSNVGYAVVLLTPDDIGAPRDRPDEEKLRARQNVIFELGYFVGKLGRSRVCALYKEGVDIPSDYQGVLYVKMDPHGGWRLLLAREIKQAGIEIDLDKAL